MASSHRFPIITAEKAASIIRDDDLVGFSGFTPAGAVKAVPKMLAVRAREAHERGEPLRLRVLTGASTGGAIDDALAEADAIAWRAPYQSSRPLRDRINRQEVRFVDLHLSHVPQMLDYGFLGRVDTAVVEAVEVTDDGRVYLTTSVGITPSLLKHADRVVIEVNRWASRRLPEMHDIALLRRPPRRDPIGIHHPLARIGTPYATVDPSKIVGIVETNEPDLVSPFAEPNEVCRRIGRHVAEFLVRELRAGRIPPEFLPMQAGVGNVANAVMDAICEHPDIPPFQMYTEVFQDAMVPLMERGHLTGASTSALTLSTEAMRRVFENMDFFAPRIVLRPQEISNNPEIVRRLGIICINTILECDIYGNANSTHVAGTQLMNGIGGSGDFTRNAYLSILVTPSIAKNGAISSVVPMVTHVDHNEHSVQILVTEHGLADLRGLGPMERAKVIIEQCAHPAYRDYLHGYIRDSRIGHISHDLDRCFELHRNLCDQGAMLPDLSIAE
ncbi:MAG: succinate CoA transferase [Phycisphaeraceae bacterium]|nr:MAG: succinate CoA transferase [Phycisphaeraceae bacterium]